MGGGGGGGGGGSGYVRRAGDDADVDVAAVERLLDERTQLRRQHDYEGADAVRDQLTGEHGVTVYDRDSTHMPRALEESPRRSCEHLLRASS